MAENFLLGMGRTAMEHHYDFEFMLGPGLEPRLSVQMASLLQAKLRLSECSGRVEDFHDQTIYPLSVAPCQWSSICLMKQHFFAFSTKSITRSQNCLSIDIDYDVLWSMAMPKQESIHQTLLYLRLATERCGRLMYIVDLHKDSRS